MLRRQLKEHLMRGTTVLAAMALTLGAASALTRTPPPQPVALVLPAAVADEAPGTIVAVPAEDAADRPQTPAFRVRRPLTWSAGTPLVANR